MENRRTILISLVCFGISVMLISWSVDLKRSALTSEFGEEINVVVAAVGIPEYATIRKGMLTTKKVFKRFKQPQTVSDVEDVVMKAAYIPFAAGEQITLTKLVNQDGSPVLHRQVRKDMRAVSLIISEHTGVAKLIRPGNRVDVMAVPTYEVKGANIWEVKTVVQNALVLATGRRVQNEVPSRVNRDVLNYIEAEFEKRGRRDFYKGGPKNTQRPTDQYRHITLQLSRRDAEKVHYLRTTFGDRSLYFALRNGADVEKKEIPSMLLDDVIGDSQIKNSLRRPKPVPRKPPKYYDFRDGKAIPVY